ncbi:MAG: hypothetical protein ACT4PV_07430 [Planctomycetaceae bacterium]
MKRLPLLLLLGACATPRPAPDDEVGRPIPLPREDPLAGFTVRGRPEVVPAFLEGETAWRFLVSRVTSARADSHALGEKLLLTFEAEAFHVTRQNGSRRSWLLPGGMRLLRVPTELLLLPDLSSRVYREGRADEGEGGEVTVVSARLDGPPPQEFRLVVKDGRTFRSIATPG